MNVGRDPGYTCLSVLSSGNKGTIEKPINNSKGCGGLMRIAPISLYIKNIDYAVKYGMEASALTHGHPLSMISSCAFSALLYYLSNTDLNIKEALDKSMKLCEKFFNKETRNYFVDLINKAVKLSECSKSDIEAISKLGKGWVAEETFAIAVYSCLKYQNSFKDAIICSVNHGGDSDSTGSVTGNIMGAYLGYDEIPLEYKNNVELKDEILELADDLSIEVPVDEFKKNNDNYWLSKYLYCKKDASLKK